MSTPLLVILDRGHGQKGRGAPFDSGATFTAPSIAGGGVLREVDLTSTYIGHAEVRLRQLGHRVELLDSGTYDARHAKAIELAANASEALYVQCHVNAGGGKYGAVEHDARSSAGRRAAAALADALDELAETPTVHVWSLDPGERGWVCIDDIWAAPTMCGLIYEPGFIDAPSHGPLWTPEGLARVGGALAEGIRRYAAGIGARRAA